MCMVRVLHEQTTYSTAFCLTLFVWRTLAILELLLLMRIVVTLFMTHPSFELEGVVDSMTLFLVTPFLLFGTSAHFEVEATLLATFSAMVVYPIFPIVAVHVLRTYDNYASVYFRQQTHSEKQASQA